MKTPQNSQDLGQGTKRLVWLLASLVLVNCAGGTGNAILPDSKKDESSADNDDDADKSAPVSGAYLTCYAPQPRETDDMMFGGCQVRAKDGRRVDMSRTHQKFSFVRPAGTKENLAIAVFDISKTKKKKLYFDAIYRVKLPPKGASLQGGTVPSRAEITSYFMNVAPVMLPSLSLLGATSAKAGKADPAPTTNDQKQKTTLSGKGKQPGMNLQDQVTAGFGEIVNFHGASRRFVETTDPAVVAKANENPMEFMVVPAASDGVNVGTVSGENRDASFLRGTPTAEGFGLDGAPVPSNDYNSSREVVSDYDATANATAATNPDPVYPQGSADAIVVSSATAGASSSADTSVFATEVWKNGSSSYEKLNEPYYSEDTSSWGSSEASGEASAGGESVYQDFSSNSSGNNSGSSSSTSTGSATTTPPVEVTPAEGS